MSDILKLARVQVLFLVVFVALKAARRPLMDLSPPEWVGVFLYSFPNFAEAIIGMMTVTMLLTAANHYLFSGRIKPAVIYLAATLISAVYVLTQEWGLHSLGGNNVFDIYDVYASVAGLVVALAMLLVIRPEVKDPVAR